MKTDAQIKQMLNRLLAVSVLLQKAEQRTSPEQQSTQHAKNHHEEERRESWPKRLNRLP